MPGTYRMGPAGLAADGPSRDGVHGQTCPDAPIPAPRDLEAGNPIHPGSPVEPSPCTEPPGVATRGWDVDGGGDAGAQTPPPPSQAGGPVRERPEREAASRPASGAPRIPGGADGVWPWSRPPVGGGADNNDDDDGSQKRVSGRAEPVHRTPRSLPGGGVHGGGVDAGARPHPPPPPSQAGGPSGNARSGSCVQARQRSPPPRGGAPTGSGRGRVPRLGGAPPLRHNHPGDR